MLYGFWLVWERKPKVQDLVQKELHEIFIISSFRKEIIFSTHETLLTGGENGRLHLNRYWLFSQKNQDQFLLREYFLHSTWKWDQSRPPWYKHVNHYQYLIKLFSHAADFSIRYKANPHLLVRQLCQTMWVIFLVNLVIFFNKTHSRCRAYIASSGNNTNGNTKTKLSKKADGWFCSLPESLHRLLWDVEAALNSQMSQTRQTFNDTLNACISDCIAAGQCHIC